MTFISCHGCLRLDQEAGGVVTMCYCVYPLSIKRGDDGVRGHGEREISGCMNLLVPRLLN